MSKYPVVGSREELDVVLSDLRKVINPSARLPDSPFLGDKGTDSFCEWESFNGGSFGPFLEALALQFHDEFVSGVRLEPDDYLDDEDMRGNFAAFHIPTSLVADEYWHALTYEPDDNPAEAIYNNADVLGAAGSSGSWAIWGERVVGVAIVRTVGADVSWRGDSDWFLPPTDALHAFIEPNFNLRPLSAEFRRTFLRNVRPVGNYQA